MFLMNLLAIFRNAAICILYNHCCSLHGLDTATILAILGRDMMHLAFDLCRDKKALVALCDIQRTIESCM
jgi:hypothetical protein